MWSRRSFRPTAELWMTPLVLLRVYEYVCVLRFHLRASIFTWRKIPFHFSDVSLRSNDPISGKEKAAKSNIEIPFRCNSWSCEANHIPATITLWYLLRVCLSLFLLRFVLTFIAVFTNIVICVCSIEVCLCGVFSF